jgi:CheY-like chemotaxis protein/HPt (histidine-containing phosphotransfer) domain-containing protein
MGGRIWLESTVGQGSAFHFTVPARVRQQPPAAARSLSGATSDELGETASGWRILVADDHRINTMFASRLLQKSGHVVATVSNGAEAVDYVLKNRPDIVLMDIQMPVKDGLQAIAQIRQHEAGSGDHVPIVALTAHAMNGYDEKCFAAGADAYLAKPLKSAELHDVMQQLLNQSQYAADSESADDAVTESDDRSAATFEPVEDVISPQAIRQNTEDDADFAQVLINVFREDLGKMIEQLDAAIREEDVETVARLAHSFKSPLDFFGAEQVRDQSHHLEKLAKAREFPQLRPEFQRLRVGLQQVDHALSTYGLDN